MPETLVVFGNIAWHLIVHAKRGVQLYDLKNDPHELRDVANTAENRSLALSLAVQVQHVTSADSK
jgi:hypothetical protein